MVAQQPLCLSGVSAHCSPSEIDPEHRDWPNLLATLFKRLGFPLCCKFCIERRRRCNFFERVSGPPKSCLLIYQRERECMNCDTRWKGGVAVRINLKLAPTDTAARVTVAGIRKLETRFIGPEWKVNMKWLSRRLLCALSGFNQIKKALLLIKPSGILLLLARGVCRVGQIMTQLDHAKSQSPFLIKPIYYRHWKENSSHLYELI